MPSDDACPAAVSAWRQVARNQHGTSLFMRASHLRCPAERQRQPRCAAEPAQSQAPSFTATTSTHRQAGPEGRVTCLRVADDEGSVQALQGKVQALAPGAQPQALKLQQRLGQAVVQLDDLAVLLTGQQRGDARKPAGARPRPSAPSSLVVGSSHRSWVTAIWSRLLGIHDDSGSLMLCLRNGMGF